MQVRNAACKRCGGAFAEAVSPPARARVSTPSWLAIWIRPRETMRELVDFDPARHVILLAWLLGIADVLSTALVRDLGDKVPLAAILGIALIIGPLNGFVRVYLPAVLLTWTGRWLGGGATSEETRAAMAWSSVPEIASLGLWIPGLALFGSELLKSETPTILASPLLTGAYVTFMGVYVLLQAWRCLLLLKCLAEVHGFSAWRALAAVLLGGFLSVLVIGALALVLMALSPGPGSSGD